MSQPKKPLRKGCQNEVIQVREADDRTIHAAANANVKTQANATASIVEILAKLYLEGDPLLNFLMQRSYNCVIGSGVSFRVPR